MTQYVPITDISHHQGDVDFEVMAARGVKGVIVRVGIGKVRDKMVGKYVPAARDAGLDVTWYWFLNPKVDVSGRVQAARALDIAEDVGIANTACMLDLEDFTHETPKGKPGPTGAELQQWYEDFAEYLAENHKRPWVYSNQAFFSAKGIDGTGMNRCRLIVPRYTIYPRGRRAGESEADYGAYIARHIATSPKPPQNAEQWDEWILNITKSRPNVPQGWTGWDGWQFSAGYNRQGPVYGCQSSDLDLNIVDAAAWAEWANGGAPVQPGRPTTPPVIVHPPVVTPTSPAEQPATPHTPPQGDPGQGVRNKMLLKYGEGSSWYHALVLTDRGLEHVKSGRARFYERAKYPFAPVDPNGAGDDEVAALIEEAGTYGPSPYGPDSPAKNDRLHALWLQHSNGGL